MRQAVEQNLASDRVGRKWASQIWQILRFGTPFMVISPVLISKRYGYGRKCNAWAASRLWLIVTNCNGLAG